jgi:hypothetical protein
MNAPLTPLDCDLRDYVWMPLDCNRLLTSETWVLGNADEKVAALTLWMKSWHQCPAGSLPDNDKMLAHMSEAGSRWPKVRDHALRGWVLCDDGRLYHPVVCEKAREAWANKLAQKARTEAARAAKAARRNGLSDAPQTVATSSVTDSVTDVATGSNRTEQNRPEQNRPSKRVEDAPRSASPPPPTGTRLPDAWIPDDPGFEGATPHTLAKFRDYWTAQPGARGRKTNWQDTWRNWCRRDAEGRTRAPAAKTSHLSTYDQNEALIRLARETAPLMSEPMRRLIG